MAKLQRQRVTYQLVGGKRQTRNVEYYGDGPVEKNADQIREILAAEHDVRADQVKLFTGKQPAAAAAAEKPKAAVPHEQLDKLSKADLVETAVKEQIAVDASGSEEKVREQVKSGLTKKYSAPE